VDKADDMQHDCSTNLLSDTNISVYMGVHGKWKIM